MERKTKNISWTRALPLRGGGIECDGFVILGDRGQDVATLIHGLTTTEVAQSIACHGTLIAAATIAKALREARQYERESEMQDRIKSILGGLGG